MVSGPGLLASITNASNSPYMELTWSDSNNQHVGVNITTGSGVTHYDAPLTINDDSWHSFALALDLDRGMGTLYVDGRTGASFPIDTNSWPVAGGKWHLGRKTDGTSYFQGNLDEVAVSESASDETTAFQATTTGLYGTTLGVTGAGGVAVVRPLAHVTAIASLIAQRRSTVIHLVSSTLGNAGAQMTFSASASLTVTIPIAPVSVPATWVATTKVIATAGDQVLVVNSVTVSIPTGGILYFPNGVVVQLVAPANVRDGLIFIAPLVGTIAMNRTGTGINPAAYAVTTSGLASAGNASVPIASNPQYMAAGSILYFTSSPNIAVTLTADAPAGATSISVSALANAIPSGTSGSGRPIPTDPGAGTAPPPGPLPSPFVNLKRVSLRYPEATLDGSGFPV